MINTSLFPPHRGLFPTFLVKPAHRSGGAGRGSTRVCAGVYVPRPAVPVRSRTLAAESGGLDQVCCAAVGLVGLTRAQQGKMTSRRRRARQIRAAVTCALGTLRSSTPPATPG